MEGLKLNQLGHGTSGSMVGTQRWSCLQNYFMFEEREYETESGHDFPCTPFSFFLGPLSEATWAPLPAWLSAGQTPKRKREARSESNRVLFDRAPLCQVSLPETP